MFDDNNEIGINPKINKYILKIYNYKKDNNKLYDNKKVLNDILLKQNDVIKKQKNQIKEKVEGNIKELNDGEDMKKMKLLI